MSVIELKTRPVKVIQSVIERLEEVLAEAKKGNIVAVAIATIDSDGSVGNAWSEIDDFGKLIGSVSRLEHRMNIKADKE